MVVLIVGLGSISKKHITALNAICNELTIYALRSSRDAGVVEGIINVFSMDEIIAKPDFAIVSNPTYKHFSTIENLIDKDIPMFIEKPALASLVGAEYLIRKMEASSLVNYVACNLRFHPCIQFVKQYLSSNSVNRINEVNIYCGSYLPNWRPSLNFREVYSANKDQGGGVHLDLFHEMDYAYWWFGKPIKTSAVLTSKSTLAIDAIDYANYLMEYPQFNVSVILNYFRKDAKRTIEIVGEVETIHVDLLKNSIEGSESGQMLQHQNFDIMYTYIYQMKYFIDHLQQNRDPMNTLSESIEALKITLVNE